MGEEVGHALRRARLARGLTLRQVGERSLGAFKPTAVAGYERAERTISLERFYALCAFYGVAPTRLLAEIEEALGRRPELTIDLTQLEDPDARSTTLGSSSTISFRGRTRGRKPTGNDASGPSAVRAGSTDRAPLEAPSTPLAVP